jgi:serine/threonine protein kinase
MCEWLANVMQIGPLGRGAFGQVTLVKWNNDFCALKQICKQQVVKSQLVNHIKAEKRLMAECDNPFLVKLQAAFQDTAHLFLLMEFVQGGELFTFMRKRRRALRESWARFYAAAVVCGFQYLGSRHMVYRCVASILLSIFPQAHAGQPHKAHPLSATHPLSAAHHGPSTRHIGWCVLSLL